MKKYRCDMCEKDFGTKEALDMHNKHKHPEEYKEPLFTGKQKKNIITYGSIILIILIIGGYLYIKSIPPEDAPIMEINPESYNFGTVSQAKGTVSTEITITNKGKSDLVIDNMDSSCGCTSAAIVYNGVEGPRFSMSMHGTNPQDWEQVIPPGDSAQLKIYYNPNVHKDLRGSVTRSIMLFSNDPVHKAQEVKISVNQVD